MRTLAGRLRPTQAPIMSSMQDRPSADELLEALEHFLEDLTANLEGSRSFHSRVAAHTVRIVRRELSGEDDALAEEWASLDATLGAEEPPPRRADARERLHARNAELCDKIRAGEAEEGDMSRQVYDHVVAVLRNKLNVSDPDLLARSESV